MEPRELFNAMKGRADLEYEASKDQWEHVRILAFHSVICHLGKKSKVKSPADLIPLPWDKKSQTKKISVEEKRELIKQSNKALGKR
jgi:hypothetical protein